MNGGSSEASVAIGKVQALVMKPNGASSVVAAKEMTTMLIIVLAAAMTLAMLIATAFGLHQEAERARVKSRDRQIGRLTFR